MELRVINGPFEGGCRLQSGAGAWLACNTSCSKSWGLQQEFPNLNHVARGLGLGVTPLESVGRT